MHTDRATYMAVELASQVAEKALRRQEIDGTSWSTCPLNTICRKAPICTITWEHARQMALTKRKDDLCEMRQAIINRTIPENVLTLIRDKILEHKLGPEFFGTLDENHNENPEELIPKELTSIVW